ncbi:GWxTD domain-containing protein [Rhodonellum sp.]|uniref:GWxTD domain-containing protein n=1 Tax=Rhodonellum sp. TaxID=2231180 RepID=UPI00271E0776|nr:GWxTD domain-containing protein [Rhodonellum sp.]MDO9552150.1 GWxTD domain-containing protein [Rhodonellum sp.]
MTTTSISSKFKLFIGLLILFIGVPEYSHSQQNLASVNQALRYSRYSRLSLKIIPIQESDRSFLLQMPIEKIEENPDFDDYIFSYTVVSSYQEAITDEKMMVLTEEDLKYDTQNHFFFEKKVEIPMGQEFAIALLKVSDRRQGDEYFYHIDLISPFIFGHPDFGAYYGNNIPFDQSFLVQNEALLFKSNSVINLNRFYYPAKFEAPFPAMEIKSPPVSRQVEVEYEGDFLINTPRSFEKEGYYFIQSDTNSTKGLMIKTAPESFPRVGNWEEMTQMVVYISTRKEHESLLEAADKKIALDQYWIGLTKNEEASKDLIREYFRQVEFANILFTDFKEGWKTDRGMVYIVMGPPNEVRFGIDDEVWSYGSMDSNSKINFTFTRVKNILTPNYYTLNRSRALQPAWFKNITVWRSGKMDF